MAQRIGVLGGTGLYAWGRGESIDVETPFGVVPVQVVQTPDATFFFISRHGTGHEVPPHAINARAQVRALAAAHVDYALGFFNVGSLDPDLPPGRWVVPSDFIDFTRRRVVTFHDDRAVHADMADPFCPHLRRALIDTAPKGTTDGGVYAAAEGPRFETLAEAKALRTLGADLAGMTLVPEAVLAREAGLCYAAVAFVANAVAPGTGEVLDPHAIQAQLASNAGAARRWIARAVPQVPRRKRCRCGVRGLPQALQARPPARRTRS